MDPRISSNYTQVEGLKIHYLSAGEPVDGSILLIHGWPTSAYLWRNIIPYISDRHQVIAIDLPGFGKSDKRLDDSYSFRYYSQILSGFVEELGLKKITLGVHDLGGPLGLYWAVHHMELVERLILFNTLVYPKLSWAVKLFGFATYTPGLRDYLTSPSGIKKTIFFGVNDSHGLTGEVIKEYQSPFPDKNSRKVLLKTVQRLSPKGFEAISERLPQFKGPVQIVYGEKDRILPKVTRTMRKVQADLPQAKVHTFPKCGHFLQEEVADEIGSVLKKFLSQGI